MTFRNGGPMSNLTGIDNPTLRISEPYTFPIGSVTDDFVANQLVYHRIEDDEQDNSYHNSLYNRSSHGNGGNHLMFASTRPQSVNGYTSKGNGHNNGFLNYQTLGRSSAPVTIGRSHQLGTVSKGALSRYHHGLDVKSSISYFDIEVDKVSSYQYRPGEEITGAVIMMIRKSMEIRFVEIIVTGQGHITTKRSGDGLPHKVRETYLQKEKCIIGGRDANLTSVLTPGHYTSKFRVHLPKDLPSTIHNEDSGTGLTFDIAYTMRVRICDNVGVPPSRASTTTTNTVRVVLEKQISFNVQRGFDINTIPDAVSPILHTEQVYLACSHQEAAIVSLHLERAVFLAGDEIRLHLEVSLPSSQRVKELTCRLEQHVTFSSLREPIVFTLSKIIRKDPIGTGDRLTNRKSEQNVIDLTIPTNTKLISPYILGNSKVKMEYFLTAELKFTPAGGKLSFKVPVGIGPCAEPIYAEKTLSKKLVPLFNKTTRFPCFSSRTLTGSTMLEPTARPPASVQVTTTYSNGFFARCLLCCMGSGDQ